LSNNAPGGVRYHRTDVDRREKIQRRIRAESVLKTVKDHGGRFIVRSNEVTRLQGDPGPKRVVIIGFESMDEVKKWQSSKDYMELRPLRDQALKLRQFAVATCANPQGAKPDKTQCP
jgi:uncharacterized protein (DUF1330 family)